MREKSVDVLILGGGPCGSTASTLLQKQGIQTTIIEGEPAPRFHVGESLLPHTLPLLEKLGVLDEVIALPHTMKKDGATFVTHDGSKNALYWFEEAMAPAIPHAYQVRRDEFDWCLMKHAEKNGAELLLGWKADEPVFEGERLVGVKTRTPEGEEVLIKSRMFLDASGQVAFLARKLKTRVPYEGHQKVAAVTHFRGAYRGPGREAGNIVIALTEGGWFWMIPFRDGTMSVGVVCDIRKWREAGGGPEELFNAAVERTPEVKRRLQGAERILDFNAVQNFSFGVSKLAGPGYCLIGDAAGFLDPIFSTGVFVSTSTAAQAAEDIGRAWKSHEVIMPAHMKRTTKRARHLQELFFSFIHSYYDASFMALFFSPTNKGLQLQAAVTSLLAADVLGPRTWSRVWRFRVLQWLGRLQKRGFNLAPALPATPA